MKNILCVIISPTIAGLCIATYGASVTYLIDFSTFFASLFFLWRIPKVPPLTAGESVPPLKAILEGFHYVRSRQELIGTYVVDFIAMVFCMPNALFPAIADAYQRKEWVGVLYAAPSVGALCLSLVSRWTLGVKMHGRFIVMAACMWALSMSMVGLSHHFYGVLIGLFFAGLFDMVSGIFRMTMWNQTIPDHFRGRLASFEMLSYMSGPLLGNTISGFMADSFGLHTALFSGGIISIALIAVVTTRLPVFWNYQRS